MNRSLSKLRACVIPSLCLLIVGLCAQSKVHAQKKRGEQFPNVTLTTQDGKEVNFYDDLVKDRVVLVNTMFTRCTGLCEQSTNKLVQLQQVLDLDPDLRNKVSIYSITVQPEFDTPERLKEYAAAHKATWTFLTGKPDDMASLRSHLGLANLNRDLKSKLFVRGSRAVTESPVKEHSDMVDIFDDSNQRWHKASTQSSTPEQLVQMIKRVISQR